VLLCCIQSVKLDTRINLLCLPIQLYVELTGDAQQPDNVPADVHIHIRHLSASYFRAGDGKVKQYRQPLGAYRKLKFDRFAISDERKCQEKKKDGNRKCF